MTSILFKILTLDSEGEIVAINPQLEGGDISEAIDEVPSARLRFLDKNKYLENLIGYTDSFPIVVSVSSNSGASYQRMFAGEVESIDLSMDDKGDRHVSFLAYGGSPFRYGFVSPNQIALGNCDFGEIFTGSPTISYHSAGSSSGGRLWNETWSSDSCGNYPNGLLYDTGYTLSNLSVVNLFADSDDIPIQIGHVTNQLLDTMRNILSPYGMSMVIFDHSNPPQVKICANSSIGSWSDNGRLTLSIGKNVSSFDRRINLTRKKDRIYAISNEDTSVFDIWGTGTNEMLVRDDDIASIDTARKIAKRALSLSAAIPEGWDAVVKPYQPTQSATMTANETLIGRSIKFIDLDYTTFSKNVIEVNQSFAPDRWVTQLRFETPEMRIGETVEEIKAQFDKQSQSDLLGTIYLKCRGLTSSIYDYFLTSSETYIYPVAIGIGTSSDTSTENLIVNWYTDSMLWDTVPGDSHFKAPVAIVPIRGKLEEGTNPNPLTQSSYAYFGSKEGIGLIKEVVVLGNINTNSALFDVKETFSWGRPSTFSGNTDFVRTALGTLSGAWPISVQRISLVSDRPSTSVYSYKLNDADIRHITDSGISLIQRTDSAWDDAYVPDKQNLLWLSQDTTSTHYATRVASFSATGTNASQVLFEWTFPIDSPEAASKYLDGISLYCIGRGTWSGGVNDVLSIYVWNTSSAAWSLWGSLTGGAGSCSIKTLSSFSNHLVDTSGKMRILFADEHGHSTGTNSIVLAYGGINVYIKNRSQDWWYDSGTSEFSTVIEKCKWDWKTGKFITTFPMWSVGGMWFGGSFSSDGTFYNVNEVVDGVSLGVNMVSKYGIKGLNENAENFSFYANSTNIDTPGQGDRTVWEDIYFGVAGEERKSYDRLLAPQLGLDERMMLWNQEYMYISYSTKRHMNLSPPQTYDPSLLNFQYISGYNGTFSSLSIDCTRAPLYGPKIQVEYSAVGRGLVDGIWEDDCIMARYVLNPTVDTASNIREGVDKNTYKEMNVQCDILGTLYPEHTIPYTASFTSTIQAMGTQRARRKMADFI